MNIFECRDYRDILKEKYENLKESKKSFTLDKISANTSIQKSYLSRVLNKKAHMSAEQVYFMTQELLLSDTEREYCELLHLANTSSSENFKRYMHIRIDKLRQRFSGAKPTLVSQNVNLSPTSLMAYYGTPLVASVHMYLCIERYRKQPQLLLRKLKVSEAQLMRCIEILLEAKIIQSDSNGYKVLKDSVQLENSNPMCNVHQLLQRTMALQEIHKNADRKSYFFSASFATSTSAKENIQQLFYKFLKDAQKAALNATDGEDVFHMNFDLFNLS